MTKLPVTSAIVGLTMAVSVVGFRCKRVGPVADHLGNGLFSRVAIQNGRRSREH